MDRGRERVVQVRCGENGEPVAFVLGQTTYGPLWVEDAWSYREPWWQTDGGGRRQIYRVRSKAGHLFDLCKMPEGDWRISRLFD